MRIEDPARRKFVEQRRNEEEKELLTGKKEASAEEQAPRESKLFIEHELTLIDDVQADH